MNDITIIEAEAKKVLEPISKPKAGDLELLSKLRGFLEQDRETKIRIDAPAAGVQACSPVQAAVSWTRSAVPGSFLADLDGKDITARFNVDDTAMKATAMLDLEGGTSPKLTASVVMFRWFPQPGPKRMEASVDFSVLEPRWKLGLGGTPGSDGFSVIDAFAGSQLPIRVSITPTQCTPPDLIVKAFTSLSAVDQVPGIGFTMPFTIAKGTDHGFLRVDIAASVAPGLYWAFVIASTPEDDAVGTATSFLPFYLNVLAP